MTKVHIIQKPVHWFALQINGLDYFYMIEISVMKKLNIYFFNPFMNNVEK